MRIDKKTRKAGHYNGTESSDENEKKKWPEDEPIKTFKPEGPNPTERTSEEERLNIDAGLS